MRKYLLFHLSLLLCLSLTATAWAQFTDPPEFLDPAVAFKAQAEAIDGNNIQIHFNVADGYYLYRDKFRFKLLAPPNWSLGKPQMPTSKEKDDPSFGRVQVYQQPVSISLPVIRPQGETSAQNLSLKLTSQGCAEAGVCYPPYSETLNVALPISTTAPTNSSNADSNVDDAGDDSETDESGAIARRLQESGFWVNLLLFFIAGLGLSLTPCVFPMIPILSSIIVGQGENLTRRRSFALSLFYVLGMALTYTAIGVMAGFTGALLSTALQNPWVLSSFALIFVLLALSMFGLFKLQLPSAWQERISSLSNKRTGGLFGVFVMGILSALIVGPCVAAPLAGALLYISQTGDALLGGTALFALSIGMGVPLLLIGLSAGVLLPKAGEWMNAVMRFFGVALLATAIWIVSPVIPSIATMLLYALLLIGYGVWLRALDPLPAEAEGKQRLAKALGVLLLLWGTALFIGVLSDSRDTLQPLKFLSARSSGGGTIDSSESAELPFIPVSSLSELETRLQQSAQEQKPVILDFYADWCTSCIEMERFTFTDQAVRDEMNKFTLLRADVTANTSDHQALLQRFNLFGPPGIIFFDYSGNEIKAMRVVGFQNAERFSKVLKAAWKRAADNP